MKHNLPFGPLSGRAIMALSGALAVLLSADSAMSTVSAQKAVFERSKPHVNVGTVDADDSGSTAAQDADNLIVDGVQDFPSTDPSAQRLSIQRNRLRQNRITLPRVRRRPLTVGAR